jgi:hypothetical protein
LSEVRERLELDLMRLVSEMLAGMCFHINMIVREMACIFIMTRRRR